MYHVKCDGQTLYDPRVDELKILQPTVTLELNKTGGFDFIIYPSHPMYGQIMRLKSSIEVYQDDYLLFRGRVLNDEHDFYNAKNIICEGDLAFFNDSILRPYNYSGSVIGFIQLIIDSHNAQVEEGKQFVLGNVTVEDPNNYIVRSSINPDKSWNVINDKLIDMLGGYIMVRRENGINYIDYLEDSSYKSLQKIELGENLLDLTKNFKSEEIITALIPYGSKLTDEEGNELDERLTIESVNNGMDYIYNQEAVDLYGWVYGTATYDDVTVASNLITKAQGELAERINMYVSIEVSAIDLSMTDAEFDQFRIFEYIEIDSPSHLLDDDMLTSKIEIHLDDPQNNKLTLGNKYKTFTEEQMQTDKVTRSNENNIKDVASQKADKHYVSEQVTALSSNIEQTADAIRTEVSETYTAQSEFNSYQEIISTEFGQLNDSFNFEFTTLTENINTFEGETQAEFEEINKYIRFINGEVNIGQENADILTIFANDEWAMLKNNKKMMWLEEDKINIRKGHFFDQLRVGNFGFVPRANGSLDFKKVSD
ncbi:Prophage endopeptidase tail [Alkalibacterium subtropicum]|uniref:Prophage endopeptidase tail n=1 Tax=Alkalibacterium subtropicum TaxID=753702 RepID=A0A1I1EUX5_9LACT|nr:phage tail protein [Alkalibacterium subtropicum]SFB90904.1 Prophage endopeptidase tail [Alkalibacterium subtropicum]